MARLCKSFCNTTIVEHWCQNIYSGVLLWSPPASLCRSGVTYFRVDRGKIFFLGETQFGRRSRVFLFSIGSLDRRRGEKMGENGFFGQNFFLLPPPPPQLRGSIHLSSSTAQKPNFFVLSSLFNFFRAHVIRQILSEREEPFPFLTGLFLTYLIHTTFWGKGRL